MLGRWLAVASRSNKRRNPIITGAFQGCHLYNGVCSLAPSNLGGKDTCLVAVAQMLKRVVPSTQDEKLQSFDHGVSP